MEKLLNKIPKFLFFTGKGGVGKTSMSCAISTALADKGGKVLLISTDPASNLDEVLDTPLKSTPTEVNSVDNLWAMNINPVVAAAEYREKMIEPYRGVLPDEAITQMEEQLSGACTVEIAGFNEFSKYVGDLDIIEKYDHIILDTAPTGHTLRLLSLPSAWNDFIADNQTGSSCLGPVSGLAEYKKLYDNVVENLKNSEKTLLILVSRAEKLSLLEANRASKELAEQGMENQHLVINGIFNQKSEDAIGKAFYEKSQLAIASTPQDLQKLESTQIGFYPNGVVGVESLRAIVNSETPKAFEGAKEKLDDALKEVGSLNSWENLIEQIESDSNGVIMTMGKGGVGKTTIASMIASQLAKKGHPVTLSTTDPAAHLEYILDDKNSNLVIEKIDPKEVTEKHIADVIAKNEGKLSPEDMDLLKEELSSPCIEEIAVFGAFAKTVAKAEDRFVVLDTAPTGHTLLLLDASSAYHKEVLKQTNNEISDELANLLPRIKDPKFTKIILVALAEATPTHEAKDLQVDLKRADITPYAWAVNRSFAMCKTEENLLCQKGINEVKYIKEIREDLSENVVISPWIAEEINNINSLEMIIKR